MISAQSGNWVAPFGITIIIDKLSAVMLWLTSVSLLGVSIYSAVGMDKNREAFGYHAILHFLIMGINGVFITGDLFNLYVWFEIILISSFFMITLGGEKAQLEASVKYMTMNLLASTFFLTGIGIVYGLTGSLNMADLAMKFQFIENRNLVGIVAIFFFVGFGIKSAIFPFYFWLPASYHTPPPVISSLFAGLLTKVGVYSFIRVFSLMFIDDVFIREVVLYSAAFTMISGALGALVKQDIRRIMNYLIICHIGYMMMGIGLNNELSFSGSIFYLIHDIIVKTFLFLIVGIIISETGKIALKDLGGLAKTHKFLAVLFLIGALSLIGVPPFSGFWPKLLLIQGALENGNIPIIIVALFASFATLYVMMKMWIEIFWKEQTYNIPHKIREEIERRRKVKYIAVGILCFFILYIGFGAENIHTLSKSIASEIDQSETYIEKVLGVEYLKNK